MPTTVTEIRGSMRNIEVDTELDLSQTSKPAWQWSPSAAHNWWERT
jgi:hypothetical protein